MENKLNVLLSDLVVFYHKLQSYHWYVSGPTFFQTHAKLEEYYDGINEQIDAVAELMLQTGFKPVSKMSEFTALAQISEAPGTYSSDINGIFTVLQKDFQYLAESAKTLKAEADEAGNYLVSAYMDELIGRYSKAIWMISQSLMH